MSTPSFPVFPFEVVEQICRCYDLQFKDITTLRACSLVCKMWTLAAQRFLFRNLSIRDNPSWERLFSILKDSQNLRPLVEELYIYFQLSWHDESTLGLIHEYLPLVTRITYVGAFPELLFLEQFRTLCGLTVRQIQYDEVIEKVVTRPNPMPYKDIAIDEFHLPDTHLPYLADWLETTSTSSKKSLRVVTLSLKYSWFNTAHRNHQQVVRIVESYINLEHLRLNLSATLFGSSQSVGVNYGIGAISTQRFTLELRPQSGVGILTVISSVLSNTTFSRLREIEILIHMNKSRLSEDRAGEPGSFLLDNAREGSGNHGVEDDEMMRQLKIPEQLCHQLQRVVIKIEGSRIDFPPVLMGMFGDAHVRGVVVVQRQSPNMLGW